MQQYIKPYRPVANDSENRKEGNAKAQQNETSDLRDVNGSLAALQQKVNHSPLVSAQASLQKKVDGTVSSEKQNPIQRVINIDGQSNQRDRVLREVQSLIAANKGIKEMDDGEPVVRIKMVRHKEEQGHRGFTRYEGEALYIELEEDMVDGINLRETLHHELLNHGYKMYQHLVARTDMNFLQKWIDNVIGYAPSELLDHLAYVSKDVDQAYGYNIIDQWYDDVKSNMQINAERLEWMTGYLDKFRDHVLERKFSIYGQLNESAAGRGVMKAWGLDTEAEDIHDQIEAVIIKQTDLRKAEINAGIQSLIL